MIDENVFRILCDVLEEFDPSASARLSGLAASPLHVVLLELSTLERERDWPPDVREILTLARAAIVLSKLEALMQKFQEYRGVT